MAQREIMTPDLWTLRELKHILEERLHRGDDELRAAEQRGEHRPEWEALWLRLLARYTAVCDAQQELDEAPSAGLFVVPVIEPLDHRHRQDDFSRRAAPARGQAVLATASRVGLERLEQHIVIAPAVKPGQLRAEVGIRRAP